MTDPAPDDTEATVTRLAGAGARRWKAIVLASSGDGKTRRRASDAVRLAGSLVLFLACVVIIRFNPRIEVRIAHLLNSPPNGILWLITLTWILGSLGVIAIAVVSGAVTRNVPLLRDVALSALATWLACVAAGVTLGHTGGRPPTPDLGPIDPGFPNVRIAVTIGVTLTALPYLSRALRRLTLALVWLALASALVVGAGLPLNVLASVAIGMAMANGVHLAFGSPLGLASVASVADALVDLGVGATTVTATPQQVWGVARYRAVPDDGDGGRPLDVSVYGRDAAGRLRRIVANKIRPLLDQAFEPVRKLARQPRKLVFMVGGNAAAQVLTAVALGASLHAFGTHLSLAAIFFTITIASMLGGVSPVPGGMGVVEAGMIAGLIGFGIADDVAVAAVFVQRLFTAYLPPIWGYASIVWLRRREYL